MSFTLQMAVEPKQLSRLPPRTREKDAFAVEVAAGAPSSSSPNLPGRPRRILVVDDNPVVLKAFELKLKSCGFEVTTLANASAVASTAGRIEADLIILDINFPASGAVGWTGFTIKQWLARFPELAAIPVIMVSGSEAADYEPKARAAGAAAFFRKPVVLPELLVTIDRLLAPKGAS